MGWRNTHKSTVVFTSSVPLLQAIPLVEVFLCHRSCKPCCGRSCDSHLSRICNTNTYRHSIVQQIRSSTWKGQRGSEANKRQQWAKHIKHDKRRFKLHPGCNLCNSSLVEVHFASFPSIFFSSAACWGSSYFSSPFAAPPSPCDGWTPWKRVKSDVLRVTWPIWSKLDYIVWIYCNILTWSYNWILHDFLIYLYLQSCDLRSLYQ